MVIIFILLKVLQAEQNSMINCISCGKAIALTGENNQKIVQQSIWSSDYTHIFTSPKIALFKKLKANILDNLCFARWLYLLAINEIYLIEEWGKNFQPLYVKIEEVKKCITLHIPLLGVFATLTRSMQLCILFKAEFKDEYHLIQTSLNQSEIH